jgi:hypothetical protein
VQAHNLAANGHRFCQPGFGLPRDQTPTDLQYSNKIEILNVASSFDFWTEIHRNSQGSIWQPCEKSGEGESRDRYLNFLGRPLFSVG